MRTIRRVSVRLNRGKWMSLCDITRCYSRERLAHLAYWRDAHIAEATAKDRGRRDALVAAGYVSPYGLQARQWKMAVKEAHETVGKQWSALAEGIRPLIAAHNTWSDAQRRYAYWQIMSVPRMARLVSGTAAAPTHFEIDHSERHVVLNYLRRVIRRKRGEHPQAKSARSFTLDGDMYTVFEERGVQYVSVMSKAARQRITIPLTGNAVISGNVRVILDRDRQRIEVHHTTEVDKVAPPGDAVCGVDAGLTEVFTDDQGARYGEGLGPCLTQASRALNTKGQRRNRLYQLANRAEDRGDHAKARRIRRYNLGQKKQREKRRRHRTTVERLINTAINQVVATRRPGVVITEKLDMRGRAQSRDISRRVALWARGVLKNRMEFKASAKGFRRKQVNTAYSSQMCPECWWVARGNRCGDRFQCLKCGHVEDADRVAARNLVAREDDPEITPYTPRARVKQILLARHIARLERPSLGEADCFGQDSRHGTGRALGPLTSPSIGERNDRGVIPGARWCHA